VRHLVVPIFVAVFVIAPAIACNQPTAPADISGTPPPTVVIPVRGTTGIVLGTGTPIAVGQQVTETVTSSDPACYPNWDASGRCRQFTLVPDRDGNLRVTLSWASSLPDAMDLFIVSPGDMLATAYEGSTRERVTVTVSAGMKYEFLAMSYIQPQTFALDFEFQP
jgi:hypothetical protein